MKIIPLNYVTCKEIHFKEYLNLLNKHNRLKNLLTRKDVLDLKHYVIKEKGKIIGGIGYRLLSWWGIEICHLVVAPKYRKGLGRKLIKFLLDEKIRPIYMATVYKDNHIALNLFGNLGFKIVSSIEKEYLLIRE